MVESAPTEPTTTLINNKQLKIPGNSGDFSFLTPGEHSVPIPKDQDTHSLF